MVRYWYLLSVIQNSINKLIAFPDHVLAVGAEDVFKIGLDGTPIDAVGDPKFTVFQKLNGTPTASLQIENQFYLFLVSSCLKYSSYISGKRLKYCGAV